MEKVLARDKSLSKVMFAVTGQANMTMVPGPNYVRKNTSWVRAL